MFVKMRLRGEIWLNAGCIEIKCCTDEECLHAAGNEFANKATDGEKSTAREDAASKNVNCGQRMKWQRSLKWNDRVLLPELNDLGTVI